MKKEKENEVKIIAGTDTSTSDDSDDLDESSREEKGSVLSLWVPPALKRQLNDYCESHPYRSRSRHICSAIRYYLESKSFTTED